MNGITNGAQRSGIDVGTGTGTGISNGNGNGIDTADALLLLSLQESHQQPPQVCADPRLSALDKLCQSRRKNHKREQDKAFWKNGVKLIQKETQTPRPAKSVAFRQTLGRFKAFISKQEPGAKASELLVLWDEDTKNRWIDRYCQAEGEFHRAPLTQYVDLTRADPGARNYRHVASPEDKRLIAGLGPAQAVPRHSTISKKQGKCRKLSEILRNRGQPPYTLDELLSLDPKRCDEILEGYAAMIPSVKAVVAALRDAQPSLPAPDPDDRPDIGVRLEGSAKSALEGTSYSLQTSPPLWAPSLD